LCRHHRDVPGKGIADTRAMPDRHRERARAEPPARHRCPPLSAPLPSIMLIESSTFFTLGYLIVFGGVIVVIVVLVRLMLWATTALKVITRDREVRLDVFLAGDENGTVDLA